MKDHLQTFKELGVPVKLVGVGETPDDVEPFNADRFVEALFESLDDLKE